MDAVKRETRIMATNRPTMSERHGDARTLREFTISFARNCFRNIANNGTETILFNDARLTNKY